MSRIDEALKRAERIEEDRPAPLAPHPTPVSDLERYAVERTAARPADVRHGAAVVEAPRRVRSARDVAPEFRGRIVSTRNIDPVAIEQYRRLAATLDEVQSARNVRSLMIASTLPREGKTLTTTNLALTLSESYKRRVLVLDADFRRPGIHEQFGLPNDVGLGDVLYAPDAVCRPIEVSPTLSIVPAGQADPSPIAALSSERMKAVVADAVSRFDWVLLDTPPVGLLTDAQLVSRVSDAVLLVIGAGITPYELVQRTIAELGADRIVGTVLNRVRPEALPARDYYGRYYSERS